MIRPLSRERLLLGALAAAVAGLVLWAVGVVLEPQRALFGWLAAFLAGVGVCLGALVLALLAHVTHARTLRLLVEPALEVAGAIPVFALLFLPVALGAAFLYPWVPPLEGFTLAEQEQLHRKAAWLNLPFFYVRSVVYLVTWSALALLLRRWTTLARATEGTADGPAALALIVLAFTGSFAAIDWAMSLSPLWLSTIYGAYVLMGGLVAGWALVLALEHGLDREGAGLVAEEQLRHRGNLLLSLVLLWGYFGFSQYLIIWMGNLPAEVPWYLRRREHGWNVVAALLFAGHFAVPSLLLLFRRFKTRPRALAALGAWLVLMHVLDAWWLVLPELGSGGFPLHWVDVAAVLAVGGSVVAAGCVLAPRRRHSRGGAHGVPAG